jgi:hypothetical protein
MHQVLTPCMQHHQNADVRSQVFRIVCQFLQRLRCGAKQDAVHHTLILQCQRSQLLRQREHDMEIRNRQQFRFPLINPGGTSHCLTLRAMPVPA